MPLGRRITSDFLRASMSVPTVVFEKTMDVSALVAARQAVEPRPSWCAIFTKAYARVVAARPDLRRAYLTFPWERLYEYQRTTADVVVEAKLAGGDVLVTMRLPRPETCPLLEIDRHLQVYKEKPVERIRRFRKALLLARFPAWVRRCVWWYVLNGSGRKRARYFATFGVSSVANWGVESLRPIAPWITLLHYGAIDALGKVAVRLTYDHRVLDGSGPSKALLELEQSLQTDLVAELTALRPEPLADVHSRWVAPAAEPTIEAR
jgi:hypothetical protein